MDKVLLVHASFGEGHKRAAFSLKDFLNAPCVDLLDFSLPLIKRLYVYAYMFITEHSTPLWQVLFSSTKNNFIKKSIERIQELIFFPFIIYLKKYKPKTVISTHPFVFYFISLVKKELGIKLIAIITDLKVHPFWVNEFVDLYFVALEETKKDLISFGIEENKIIDGFVPLRDGFLSELSETEIRNKFNLDLKPCLLFMSSVRGKFPFFKQLIYHLKDDFNIFVIYGKNLELRKYLEDINLPCIKFFPVYNEIWNFFQLSSVIITKPGGLTVFEGLYKRKTFIFMRYIPGQEEENMNLLIRYGIGKFASNTEEFLEALSYLKAREKELKDRYPLVVKDLRSILKKYLAT